MAQKGNNYRHGYYGTPTYKSWSEMKYRCDKNIKNYKYVTYCEKWKEFKNFLNDMGERPEGTTLDRVDVNGNYNAKNCRWATYKQQNNNKHIANKYKISRSNLANKIYIYKWNINDAIKYLIERGGFYGTKEDV